MSLTFCHVTHSDGDVDRTDGGLPVRMNGHHPELDLLTWAIVGFVSLDEGGDTLEIDIQFGSVVEN